MSQKESQKGIMLEKLKQRNGNKEKVKDQKGITLITLVVTIIILIIIAAISIRAISGNEGILGTAESAKDATAIAEEKETVEMAVVQAMGLNKYAAIVADEVQTQLDSLAGDGETVVTDYGEILIVEFVESRRMYAIDTETGEDEYTIEITTLKAYTISEDTYTDTYFGEGLSNTE